ncbi:MAG: DUF4065 domain-containing protein [Bacilli bacterium]|nr:DUF4065 domain-containing protein [Bacilli bacterium]
MSKAKVSFDVIDIANYISNKYKNTYNANISPLKLQKVLYLIFAEWGSFVRNSINNLESVEIDLNDYNEYLFNSEFEAWMYGPVLPEVYYTFEMNEDQKPEDIFDTIEKKYVQSFIDDFSETLFKISDFRLVDITHEDQCWKNHFHAENTHHNEMIPKEEIIREYAARI